MERLFGNNMLSRRITTRAFHTSPVSLIHSGSATALSVFQNSCYKKVDFRIHEESYLKEALSRFSALNVGCLAVIDERQKVVGVISKRDYVNKVGALDRDHHGLKVKDICTYGHNVIVAKKTDSLETCMNKMLFKNIRHLLILDESEPEFVGMLSIKDLIQEIMKDNKEIITRLSDFHLGKGAFFGSE